MLRRIEVFVAVTEEKSFTAAAKMMRAPQPQLSAQFRRLEESFGVELI
jgi:DNA-binding transcriptional LysR family regulator